MGINAMPFLNAELLLLNTSMSFSSFEMSKIEVAEFHVTFYGGSTYRIAACSGLSDGNLIFSVYDKDRNLLFTNSDYSNSSHWDFKINSTVDCIIEAHLNPDQLASGCAVLLIAFKQ